MAQTTIGKGMRVGAVMAIFAAGWVCGSLSGRTAGAQLGGDLGKAAMEKAGDQGNVDTLKGIQSLLGG